MIAVKKDLFHHMTKSPSEYEDVLVESYINTSKPSRHGDVHIRPVKGQGFPDYYGVECSKKLLYGFPLGTKFLIQARIKGGTHLYSHYRARFEVADQSQLTEITVDEERSETLNLSNELKEKEISLGKILDHLIIYLGKIKQWLFSVKTDKGTKK